MMFEHGAASYQYLIGWYSYDVYLYRYKKLLKVKTLDCKPKFYISSYFYTDCMIDLCAHLVIAVRCSM
jgi:hypothetical protein